MGGRKSARLLKRGPLLERARFADPREPLEGVDGPALEVSCGPPRPNPENPMEADVPPRIQPLAHDSHRLGAGEWARKISQEERFRLRVGRYLRLPRAAEGELHCRNQLASVCRLEHPKGLGPVPIF